MSKYIKIIYTGGSAELVEKKSRFIANVFPVSNEEQAYQCIDKIKKEHYNARHNCFAFSIGEEMPVLRFSDDGEPQGTAGKPILEIIASSEISNVCIVVTRYFGGTLLGTGGLVRAYSGAAKEAIKNSTIIEKAKGIKVKIITNYNDMGKIQYALGNLQVDIIDIVYEVDVVMNIVVLEDQFAMVQKQLIEITAGRAMINKQNLVYFGKMDKELLFF